MQRKESYSVLLEMFYFQLTTLAIIINYLLLKEISA